MEPVFPGTEQLVLCDDRATGLRAVIAIDDTTLGPGLGGVRLKAYASDADAVTEARRLAAAMTLKNAAAELPYGGGKAVIVADGPIADRAALMRAFGRFVARTGGAYLPGVDMGTTTADLAEVGRVAPDVACDQEDPSGWTALGVWAGICATARQLDRRDDLGGLTVAIQGVGHVGADLARRVARDGARVLVADVDGQRAADVAAEVGGTVVTADEIVTAPCDVLAPCAAARVIDRATLPRLRCRAIAGAANDVLADAELADGLRRAGIAYVPDFLINAGGVIHIHALRAGWSASRLEAEVLAIGDRVERVLHDAARAHRPPLDQAVERARARIAAARPTPDVRLAA
ncbi:Glu/Leu/Phe/Val dehydrogenase family protein [Patulibacter defluvii]|uniref:Glu/Leu/Phe/Val dehydrogenase family protein n=1 Tax=Patulibacter defluvii TaxID=3095358 RepID=UPI002A74B203|nr:Glu/Leu/Phe/Val dehydrogenase dimerization domain-containing protein [Patulibacter sp. DM4]